MTSKPSSSGGARRTRCHCGQPVLRQFVGALDVTADTERLTLAAALQRTGPNRLAWCLYQQSEWTPQKLREVHRSTHPAGCPHPHVVDHECAGPPPTARPANRSRTRKTTPVHPGQLAL